MVCKIGGRGFFLSLNLFIRFDELPYSLLKPSITISDLKQRNRFVFKAFFKSHYKALVHYAHGFLFDTDASEDVVQEVFITLWEKLPDLEIKTSPKSYVYSMVRNHCLNQLKAIQLTDKLQLLDLNNIMVSEYDLNEFSLDQKRMIYNQVLVIVDDLPPRMREIFEMRYFYNYKYKEIAEELAISVNTVKIQLRRSKTRIGQLATSLLVLLASS